MMQRLRALLPAIASTPRIPFQILSDLHLEVNQQYTAYHILPSAPHLILAGDIGRLVDYDGYLAFLTNHASKFEMILLVLGNHEFYNVSFTDGIRKAEGLVREPALMGKVTLLHRARIDIPNADVVVLGCTLWSCIPPSSADVVGLKVSDFKKIEGWSISAHNAAFDQDLQWLRAQVRILGEENARIVSTGGKGATQKRILIATHHAPCASGTSEPQHEGSELACAFATDLLVGGEREWKLEGVRTWVFGHTHWCADFKVGGMRIVANQRGYVLNVEREEEERKKGGKGKGRGFDMGKVVMV